MCENFSRVSNEECQSRPSKEGWELDRGAIMTGTAMPEENGDTKKELVSGRVGRVRKAAVCLMA